MFKASNTTFEIHVIRRFRAQMPGKTALADLILLLFLKEGKPYNETALTETVQCTRWIARHSVDNQDGVRTVHTYMQRSIRIEPPQRPRMEPVRFYRSRYGLYPMTQHYLVERILPSVIKSEAGFEHRCTMCIVWTVLDDTPLTESEEL